MIAAQYTRITKFDYLFRGAQCTLSNSTRDDPKRQEFSAVVCIHILNIFFPTTTSFSWIVAQEENKLLHISKHEQK